MGKRWLLERGYSQRLAMLVGGHVDAKRYLTATNHGYMERFSPASVETLRLQGGPMTDEDLAAYGAQPELRDMPRLRSWNEMARDSAWTGPGIVPGQVDPPIGRRLPGRRLDRRITIEPVPFPAARRGCGSKVEMSPLATRPYGGRPNESLPFPSSLIVLHRGQPSRLSCRAKAGGLDSPRPRSWINS